MCETRNFSSSKLVASLVIVIFLALSLIISVLSYADKIKVACIGNSVTYGYLLPDREKNAYPFQLQEMLGEDYEVGNFGKSGATLLNKGHRPYMQQQEYKDAMAFGGDIAVIHLGLNDTDPRNWPNYSEDFEKDYYALIDSVRKANPKCKIWICRMSPITDKHWRFKSGTRDWYRQIQTHIEDIAKIDLEYLIVYSENGLDMEETVVDPMSGEEVVQIVNVPQTALEQLKASVKIDVTPKGVYDKFAQEQTIENLLLNGMFSAQRVAEFKAYVDALDDDSVAPKLKLEEIVNNILKEQQRIAQIEAQAQMMQQRAQQFLMGDPDEQSSMMADAKRMLMQQQMPDEGQYEAMEAELDAEVPVEE